MTCAGYRIGLREKIRRRKAIAVIRDFRITAFSLENIFIFNVQKYCLGVQVWII